MICQNLGATQFEQKSHLLKNYLSISKQSGKFFPIFVAFSEYLNFKARNFSTVAIIKCEFKNVLTRDTITMMVGVVRCEIWRSVCGYKFFFSKSRLLLTMAWFAKICPKIIMALFVLMPGPFNMSYLTDSYIIFTFKMESVSKNTIFGLKMMVKSGLEKFILKSLHAGR